MTPSSLDRWRRLGNNPEDAVLTVIGGHYGVPARSLTRTTRLAQDLGADQIDAREVLMTLEELFNVYFAPHGDEVLTVGEVIDLVKQGLHNSHEPQPRTEFA